MRATCPTNADHRQFVTTAHVMEEWLVTAEGSFVQTLNSLETTHGPDAGNIWTCFECGAEAYVAD